MADKYIKKIGIQLKKLLVEYVENNKNNKAFIGNNKEDFFQDMRDLCEISSTIQRIEEIEKSKRLKASELFPEHYEPSSEALLMRQLEETNTDKHIADVLSLFKDVDLTYLELLRKTA